MQVHNVCLFKCEKCEVFFKSKKGYEGHVANRHTPRVMGADGKMKSKKEMEGLNKVNLVNLHIITEGHRDNIPGFERDPGQEGG